MIKRGNFTGSSPAPEPFSVIPVQKLPSIAIIMDGNRRWASRRLLTKMAGHKAGAENLRKLSERMNDNGFKNLTVYAFSTENWNRPKEEVDSLMGLLGDYIQQYINDSKKNNIRISTIGDLTGLNSVLQDKLLYLQELTANHSGMRLTIAINYGGRDEIVRALNIIVDDALSGVLRPEQLTEELFSSYLDTAGVPDPDLIIRTSGEMRISNFLLWQSAYSELFVSPKLWPDFNYNDLMEAVNAYNSRDRRLGAK